MLWGLEQKLVSLLAENLGKGGGLRGAGWRGNRITGGRRIGEPRCWKSRSSKAKHMGREGSVGDQQKQDQQYQKLSRSR